MVKLRVAHLTIGFPPVKRGGLVQYVTDLMKRQLKDKRFEYVTAFYPGYHNFSRRSKIKKRSYESCEIFEIINPSPTTLTEGTKYPERDVNCGYEELILKKLIEIGINIVHIHTVFGFSAALIKRIKGLGITTIYTAHDYLPLCPMINLLDAEGIVCTNNNYGHKCAVCNRFALSELSIAVRNSSLGMFLQKFQLLKSFVKGKIAHSRQKAEDEKRISDLGANLYYTRMLAYVDVLNNYIDTIIYSSLLVANYYKLFGVTGKSLMFPISNEKILKENVDKQYQVDLSGKDRIIFGFLGGNRFEKGFSVLFDVFSKIYNKGLVDWELRLLGDGAKHIETSSLICADKINKVGYIKDNIYKEFDVLIMPSIWPETFGFIVPESIVNHKMIVSSDMVGSAGFLSNTGIIIYKHDDKEELAAILEDLIVNKPIITINIGELMQKLCFDKHYTEITKIYDNLNYIRDLRG